MQSLWNQISQESHAITGRLWFHVHAFPQSPHGNLGGPGLHSMSEDWHIRSRLRYRKTDFLFRMRICLQGCFVMKLRERPKTVACKNLMWTWLLCSPRSYLWSALIKSCRNIVNLLSIFERWVGKLVASDITAQKIAGKVDDNILLCCGER